MKTSMKLGLAIALATVIAAPIGFAQDDAAPTMPGAGMMQGMMGGDASGMQGMMGMMQMMQAMGPMMAACTEMMEQTAHHRPGHDGDAPPPAGNGAAPVPQGG